MIIDKTVFQSIVKTFQCILTVKTLQKENVDKQLQNRFSSTLLKCLNKFKKKQSGTYTCVQQKTIKAPEVSNRFKLSEHIKVGYKIILENHAEQLLKSKKLPVLRSGPYTVSKQLTNTTQELVHDSTERKKVEQRSFGRILFIW